MYLIDNNYINKPLNVNGLCLWLVREIENRRRRSSVPGSLQLVPVTRIEKLNVANGKDRGWRMANRDGPSSSDDRRSENFLRTGRPSDRDWMEMKRVRPRWSGHETRNTMDSEIGYTQDLYGPAHVQLVGRKRRADDDSLVIPSAEALESEGRIPWDAPHKRILFEGPHSTSSESGIQEARPGCPPDNVYPDSTQYGQLARKRDREEIRLPGFTLEQRVLKLQKDLEEAKAESRYLRANRLATPVGTPSR